MVAIKVGINGFGRIGRLFYRAAMRQGGIEIVGINDLVSADNLAYLVQRDTVHGRFEKSVTASEGSLSCEGVSTRCTSERDPANLPWAELGVDYVLESTGLFTTGYDAGKHLAAGAKRVLISAPTKTPDEVKTLVYKVNHEQYDPATDQIISNASCTTNCLAPVTKVILDNFGLEEGLMTTVHAATATQPTQDGASKKDWRGGRNAYMNIIPASTGAAKAVALCIPEVEGRLTGMAFRVPTANVSCVDLTFRTSQPTSLEAINRAMSEAANGPMAGALDYTEEQVVSSDFIGDPHSSIFDAKAGIQLNDTFFKIVSWYDNESGYAHRCADMLRMMASFDGIS
ncbi:MAG: type I glyceraldehyde-3-phosphate dehydrogenase [Planctomycetota bacterium]|nr:type I glyceraldehyde-3-phosphate dehydrogenase [Planctomycetota bacterium]MEC9232524.1 type I glyceraldehyde-3-phosphate dehydrogenase [Planctomycetota bacterium]